MTTHQLLRTVGLLYFAVAALAASAAEPTLKEIMQGLRDNLVEITDGLLVDDFERVAQGATSIANHAPISAPQLELITAELGPAMTAFKQFDKLVHQLSLSITVAANEGKRDRVIDDYGRMINGCLSCHAAYKERVAAVLSRTP